MGHMPPLKDVSIRTDAPDDGSAGWGNEAESLGTDRDFAGIADADTGLLAPDKGPPGTSRGGAQNGALLGKGLLVSGEWGGAQFAVDFVLVGMGEKLVQKCPIRGAGAQGGRSLAWELSQVREPRTHRCPQDSRSLVHTGDDTMDHPGASQLSFLRHQTTARWSGLFLNLRLVGVSLGTHSDAHPNHPKRRRHLSRAGDFPGIRRFAKGGSGQSWPAYDYQPEKRCEATADHAEAKRLLKQLIPRDKVGPIPGAQTEFPGADSGWTI